MIWALVAAAVASALTAAARTAHHAVKTGEAPWDNMEAYTGLAASAVPFVGPLLESATYEAFPGGQEADWERSGISTGISLAGAGLGAVGGAAGSAGSSAGGAAGGAADATGSVVGELANAAGETAADVGAGFAEVANTAPALLTAETVPGQAVNFASQFPKAASLAGENLASGTTRGLGSTLADIGKNVATQENVILQGARRVSDFVNTNISRPVHSITHSPDRLISSGLGGGKIADRVGGVAGDTLRGAATGAAQDPKRPGRGALMGAAGGAANSTFAAALGGVVPREVDITYETAVANRERIPLRMGETLDSTGATGLGRDPFLSPSEVGLGSTSSKRQRIPLGTQHTLESTGATGVGPAGDPDWAASAGFSYPLLPTRKLNPTFGQQTAASALDTAGSTLGNVASTKVGQLLTPEQQQQDPFKPRSLGEISPMQRARLYGRNYSRPNVRRYYL